MHIENSSELIAWLKRKNLFAKKSLSQNFLIDFEIIDKIIDVSHVSKADTILEIGPGPGTLTIALLKSAEHVVSVEKDKRFAKELRLIFSKFSNFTIVENDILKVIDNIILDHKQLKVIANIPYHITSSILEKLCTLSAHIKSATLMVQKEFGERVCATKGKTSGSISRFVQFYYDARIAHIVSKSCFLPAPKVDSCILVLKPKNTPKIDEEAFFAFVRFSFQNRRKKLISSLKKIHSIKKLQSAFKTLNLYENTRAEELNLEMFLKLFKLLQD